ncbi:hypothetical protein ACWGII_25945 [Streptomyces sp. NPDC054855]
MEQFLLLPSELITPRAFAWQLADQLRMYFYRRQHQLEWEAQPSWRCGQRSGTDEAFRRGMIPTCM